jgi:hypothetical protein
MECLFANRSGHFLKQDLQVIQCLNFSRMERERMDMLRYAPMVVLSGFLMASVEGVVHAQNMEPAYTRIENAVAVDTQRVDFNRSLKRLGFAEELGSCKLLVKLHQDARDNSFGEICTIGGAPARDVLVCDDTMIGKFTIKAWALPRLLKK